MRAEKERLDPGFVRLAVILLTGVMVVVFDTTIVTVAINTLRPRSARCSARSSPTTGPAAGAS
jgi:hypothetical protein